MDNFLNDLTDEELVALYTDIDRETKNVSFCLFNCYNARDVEVLTGLDKKFKFFQIVNTMAHENTVPFSAMLGTVRYVETGIMNFAHNMPEDLSSVFGTNMLISADKVFSNVKNKKVEGAIVMVPRMGLWDWIGSVDLTSLYPSVIRALNMSIETFIGQFGASDDPQYGEDAWYAIWKKHDTQWIANIDGQDYEMTGAEWHEFMRKQNWAISAFGTIFDQSKPGMVASVLTFWFNERKRLQKEKKKYAKLADEETDPVKKAEYEKLEEHYDLLQLTKKIQLNSTYGALLNEAFRFGRREIGASVTGSGRQITKFMGETIGTILTGEQCEFLKRYSYNPKNGKKIKGELISVAYRDEDKSLFENMPSRQYEYDIDDEGDDDQDDKDSNGAVWFTWNKSIIYGDTDSVDAKSRVKTNIGDYTIEDLFSALPEKWNVGSKEFASTQNLKSLCFDGQKVINKSVRSVYRHKVKKRKWEILLTDGKSVIVTEDHSIMVLRDGKMIEVKPFDINRDTDMCISIQDYE